MKKKIIALLLMTVVVCNSTTTLAATSGKTDEGVGNGESKTQDVTASFSLSGAGETYSVDISWGALSYEPISTVSGSWEADEGYYSVDSFPGWQSSAAGTADIVTVTNKSNVNVTATFAQTIDPTFKSDYFTTDPGANAKLTFTAKDDSTSIFATDILTLGSAATSGQTEGGVVVGVTAAIDKVPGNKGTTISDLKLGTVTVTIAKK